MPAKESQFYKAIRVIRQGGLVIAPTETFYGILGNASSGNVVKRLLQLKGRDYGKPVPLIAGSVSVVRESTRDLPPIFVPIVNQFWPGPLTLVLRAARGFSQDVTGGTDSLGIRVPGQSPALDLARFHRGPLTATSANFQGQPAPRSVQDLDPDLVVGVDHIIDGGWTPGNLPSTVLDLIPDPPVILRRGVLGDEVEKFLKELEGTGKRE